MKILYITSLLSKKGSSASIRNTALINGLVDEGCELEVLTVDHSKGFEDDYLKNKLNKKVKVRKYELKIITNYLKKINRENTNQKVAKKSKKKLLLNIAKKLVKEVYFFPDESKEWLNYSFDEYSKKNYDLIISSSDNKTSHFIAEKIIKNKVAKVKWVQIWGDPWYSDIGLKGLRKIRAYFAEKKILKKAERIFYVSKPTLKYMKEKNSEVGEKMRYIPRGYLSKIIGEKRERANYKLIYTGVINQGRNLSDLLNGIKNYNEKKIKKVKLEIYGRIDESSLREISKYKDVIHKGLVTYDKVEEKYREADALLFISNKKGSTQIPGKLYDYFGTNKSILSVVEDENDEISKFIKETKRTIVVQSKGEKIEKGLEKLIEEIENTIQKPLEEYSGQEIAKKILTDIKGEVDYD